MVWLPIDRLPMILKGDGSLNIFHKSFNWRMVPTKWNIRGTWNKTMNKHKDESKSGSSAKKAGNYAHQEQSPFLKKVIDPRRPHDAVAKDPGDETEEGMESSAENSNFNLPPPEDTVKNDRDVNELMVKFLESRKNGERENHHLSFFKGIKPALNTLTIDETLEFQAGVLVLLQRIKLRSYRRKNKHKEHDDELCLDSSSMGDGNGQEQYLPRYYTHHNGTTKQSKSAQNVYHSGYYKQHNGKNQRRMPSTPSPVLSNSSQPYNSIPGSPTTFSVNSLLFHDIDFDEI
ncbi:uncharacterized protein LOC142973289 [Anticarsia gemmatalis]|uniref:uncharacterized protein LOC142973289 n=1 Tax=Anticarsia gemmatalis TaxID=129554 RepID=UPI003F758E68